MISSTKAVCLVEMAFSSVNAQNLVNPLDKCRRSLRGHVTLVESGK